MSFPRYGEYKDSGVEWLGEVPAHWELKRLKHGLRLLTEKTDRRTFPVALENIDGWSGRFLSTETEFEGDGVAFETGDILFGKLRPYLAKVLLASLPGEAVGDFHVLRPMPGVNGQFIQYQMLSRDFIMVVDGSTFGSKMPRASWHFLGSVPLMFPSVSEQTAIVAFLDRETAKIDTLVAEQERLIALLKEKRQAVISHAVTKGLNPAAPMKDSGIEWLGTVPEHWEVLPVKRLVEIATSGPRGWSEMATDAGALFFQSQNIGRAMDVVLEDAKTIMPPDDADAERAKLQTEDVVVCITGARTGSVAHISALPDTAYVNQHVCLLRPIPDEANGRFLAYFLWSFSGQEQLNAAMYGLKQGLGLEQVRNQFVPCPPRSEQSAIVSYLDKEANQFNTLITEAQRAIDLLKEHRAALISAAVTGKIDVRGQVGEQQKRNKVKNLLTEMRALDRSIICEGRGPAATWRRVDGQSSKKEKR